MGASSLSSRAVIGEFFHRLETSAGVPWVEQISMLFNSDQESETYKWLGQSPALREWIGGRNAKGFVDNGITIKNKKYESTLRIPVDDLRRDKTGQIQLRISEQVSRLNSHWSSLLSTLVVNGASQACYDGQYFFDTDHQEGSSGTQSNNISVDISALSAAVHGSTTKPSSEEAALSALAGIQQMLSFVDNEGEPLNEMASNFLVMVPIALMGPFMSAVRSDSFGDSGFNALKSTGFNIQVAGNPRLSSWTDSFVVFRADGTAKPFIRQQDGAPVISALVEGSDYEFNEDAHLYGIKANRNAGYGMWQHACKVQMV